MAFTEFQFDREAVKEKTAEYKRNLKANTGRDDFVMNAVETFQQRLKKDRRRYRDYGPYWPAVKRILRKYDTVPGNIDWPDVAAAYCGENDAETLVMAEEFRSFYLDRYFLYTNNFLLDENDEAEWICFDPDYEK